MMMTIDLPHMESPYIRRVLLISVFSLSHDSNVGIKGINFFTTVWVWLGWAQFEADKQTAMSLHLKYFFI